MFDNWDKPSVNAHAAERARQRGSAHFVDRLAGLQRAKEEQEAASASLHQAPEVTETLKKKRGWRNPLLALGALGLLGTGYALAPSSQYKYRDPFSSDEYTYNPNVF